MSAISLGKVVVTTAGTIKQASTTSILCCAIVVTPLSTNTGNVYPGQATLNKTTLAGAYHDGLSAGQIWQLGDIGGKNILDASLFYIDVDTGHDGEGAVIYYIQS